MRFRYHCSSIISFRLIAHPLYHLGSPHNAILWSLIVIVVYQYWCHQSLCEYCHFARISIEFKCALVTNIHWNCNLHDGLQENFGSVAMHDVKYCQVSLQRGPIYHDITYGAAINIIQWWISPTAVDIRKWMINNIHRKLWDILTYPCWKFSQCRFSQFIWGKGGSVIWIIRFRW